MTKDEALKLALEALENLGDASDRDVSPAKWDASGAQEAWEAIKKALAHPDHIANLAVAHEREACALLAQRFHIHGYDMTGDMELHEVIRARSQS